MALAERRAKSCKEFWFVRKRASASPVATLGSREGQIDMAHAGMDTSTYPGDSKMAALRATTNLSWCGFYLAPAPSHPNRSWMDRREHLVQAGWGLAPLYLGQQEAGPGSHLVTAAQGLKDGDHACHLALEAGFPVGSIIYLDLEKGGPISAAVAQYLARWSERVAAGGFVPGAYCSHTSAASALHAVADLCLWVFKVLNVDVAVDKVAPFKDDDPARSHVASATVWQWAQNCKVATPAGTVLVDLDTATSPDPSQPASPSPPGIQASASAS
jgi:Domain of unknown function (DUF1906)